MAFSFSPEQIEERRILEEYHKENPHEILFQSSYAWLVNETDWRYGILSGGRCSAKSISAIDLSIFYATQASIELLFVREFQESISKSSKQELENRIKFYSLEDQFKITDTYIENRKTGSVYSFIGVNRNPVSVKSRSNVSFVLIEEAETISAESLDILIPTIRRDDSIVLVNFNPRLVTDACWQYFMVNPPPNTRVSHTTYMDNIFCPEPMIALAEQCKISDPNKYNWVWEGKTISSSELSICKRIRNTPSDLSDSYLNKPIIVGIDIARDGGDRTCWYAIQGHKILGRGSSNYMDGPQLVQLVKNLSFSFPNCKINIDSTGSGSWAADTVRQSCPNVNIEAVNFSERSPKEAYKNMRAYLYSLVDEWMDNGGYLPNNADYKGLLEELQVHEYKFDAHNKIQLMSKDEVKSILKRSPDESDAFCLALYTNGESITKSKIDIARNTLRMKSFPRRR